MLCWNGIFKRLYSSKWEYMSVRIWLDKSDPTDRSISIHYYLIYTSVWRTIFMCVIRPLTFTVIWAMFSNFSAFLFIFIYFLFIFSRLSDQNCLQRKEKTWFIYVQITDSVFLTKCILSGVKDFWGIMSTFMVVCWKEFNPHT